jgi:hypothetical protein
MGNAIATLHSINYRFLGVDLPGEDATQLAPKAAEISE